MKTIFLFAGVVSLIGFTSIKKNPASQPHDTPPIISSPRTELLSSRSWIYEEYIRDFSQSASQVYKRNRKRNSFDLTQNIIRFYADGTFEELNENGEHLKGKWKFLENETKLETTIPGTYYHNISVIKMLTEDRLEWHDEDWDTYGEEIHPPDVDVADPKFL